MDLCWTAHIYLLTLGTYVGTRAQPYRKGEELGEHLGEAQGRVLLLHVEWSQLRWLGLPTVCLPLEVFRTCPTRKRPYGLAQVKAEGLYFSPGLGAPGDPPGVRAAWDSLLKLLPPRPRPGEVSFLNCWTSEVGSIHPECSIVLHLQQKEGECKLQMETVASSMANETAGCVTEWDGVSCWPPTSEGNTVSVNCPLLLWKSDAPPALITRRCTRHGWSEPSPPYYRACHFDADEQEEDIRMERDYFDTLKLIYSIGYGVSLAALLIAVLLFCCLRRLLCTRSYIHLNLFTTFILRSLTVFVKDGVLFADTNTDHCTVSTLQCKLAVTFFHFCILSNFSWLLVEGLYLQTLLVFTFSNISSLFWIYVGFGWGIPSVTIVLWAVLKRQTDDEGCWDTLESRLWWIIKTPILFSIFINLVIFLNISRIIVQKTMAPQESPSQTHVHRRLVRSTLLLIPLFGLHYVVFALFPEHVGVGPRLFLELVLGSFQGFIVAVLYCFLNAEVQKEIRREARGCWPDANTIVINLPTQEFIP